MTVTVSDIGHGVAALVGSSIASSTASNVTRVTHCVFFNTHTSAVTVTVYYLRSSETTASDGAYLARKQIAPSSSWMCSEATNQNIGGGGSLFIVPSVDAVISYNVSGDIIS